MKFTHSTDKVSTDFIVDVSDSPIIQSIHIYQRSDCCQGRNENLKVWLNGKTIQCQPAENYDSVSILVNLGESMLPLIFNCNSMDTVTNITVEPTDVSLAILEIEATAVRCGESVCEQTQATGLTYPGNCYEDNPNNRDLPHELLIPSGLSDSTVWCLSQCGGLGYIYAGIQYSSQCFCGNSFGKYGIAPDSDCSRSCQDTSGTKTCGGTSRNNIYLSTGLIVVNRCTCDNGTGAFGNSCQVDGTAVCSACDYGYELSETNCAAVEQTVVPDNLTNYSAFKNISPTTSIWSFLEIFRIIFGQKNKFSNCL